MLVNQLNCIKEKSEENLTTKEIEEKNKVKNCLLELSFKSPCQYNSINPLNYLCRKMPIAIKLL